MIFKAVVASIGRNDIVLAKSFVIAAKGNALAWYSILKPKSIYSWENLHDKIMAIFKAFTSESLIASNANSSQGLKGYYHKFVQLKSRAPNVPEDVAIEAAIKGLHTGPFGGHLAKEKPSSIEELYNEFKKYCRYDNDLRKRMEEQYQYKQHA